MVAVVDVVAETEDPVTLPIVAFGRVGENDEDGVRGSGLD